MTILTILPTDSFVTAALAELLDDVTNLLDSAKAQKPQDKEEIGFWRRQLNALNKAEFDYVSGVRPVISGDAYLVPSASRPGALIHRLRKAGGIVVCSCEAGQRGLLCRHHMLIKVLERAAELESAAQKEAAIAGGGPETTPAAQPNPIPHGKEAAAWLTLQTRLAATARTLDAMRAAQQRTPIAAQHIRQQARAAYARAAQPAFRRPLFAERDAETFRRHALGEERAELLELRAGRQQRFDPPFEDNPLGSEEGDEVPARRLGMRLAVARKRSAYFASAFYLAA